MSCGVLSGAALGWGGSLLFGFTISENSRLPTTHSTPEPQTLNPKIPTPNPNPKPQTQEREGDVSFEEQLKGLEAVIRAGKVRYVGVSNETSYGVSEFAHAAKSAGLPKIQTIQVGGGCRMCWSCAWQGGVWWGWWGVGCCVCCAEGFFRDFVSRSTDAHPPSSFATTTNATTNTTTTTDTNTDTAELLPSAVPHCV